MYMGKVFTTMISYAEAIKERLKKFDYIKIKHFFLHGKA